MFAKTAVAANERLKSVLALCYMQHIKCISSLGVHTRSRIHRESAAPHSGRIRSLTHSSAKNHPAVKTSLNSYLFDVNKALSKVREEAIGFDLSFSRKYVHSRPVDCFSCGAHHIQFFSPGSNFQKTYWRAKIAVELLTADLLVKR